MDYPFPGYRQGSGIYRVCRKYAVVTGYRTSEAGTVIRNGSGNELSKDDDVYTISNTRKPAELTLKKTVRGSGGDRTEKFSFSYVSRQKQLLMRLYAACTGASSSEISTGFSGAATGTVQLADTETFIVEDLPEGAKIIITEAVNDHTAEYRAAIGSDSASGSNPSENTALATEQLTVTDGATVVSTNVKDTVVPLPTGRARSNSFVLFTMLALSAALYAILRKKKLLVK